MQVVAKTPGGTTHTIWSTLPTYEAWIAGPGLSGNASRAQGDTRGWHDRLTMRRELFGLVALGLAFSAAAGAELIDLKEYWPQPDSGTVLIVRFDSGRFGFYRKAQDGFTLGDYWHKHTEPDEPSTLIWSSTWHYRVTAADGVVEFQDDVPASASSPLAPGY